MKKYIKINLFFFLLLIITSTYSKLKTTNIFNTINQLQEYAASHEEYPDIDNANWLRPQYTSFHTKNRPSWATKILQFLRLKKQPLWTAKQFKTIIKNVTRYRENNAHRGRFVKRIHPKPKAKFIVWGHLFGAFHSLVRCLDYLHKKNIIDKDLTIIKKDHFIVFNGDAINISPYILETLTIILKLMEKNPQQVIYIRGKHEDKEYWLNYGLTEELKIKAAHVSAEAIPLQSLINKFFNTLPLALYLTADSKDSLKAVRISVHDRNYEELNESKLKKLFEEKHSKRPNIFNLRQAKQEDTPNVQVDVIVKSANNKTTPPKGLKSIKTGKGKMSFVLFSSPTKPHRAMYNFFFDAFSIIDIKKHFDNWTITLFNQDVRKKQGFTKQETYNLVSGNIISQEGGADSNIQRKAKKLEKQLKACKKTLKEKQEQLKKTKKTPHAPQAKPTPIKPGTPEQETVTGELNVGTTLDLTSPLSILGKQIKRILNDIIDNTNDAGGINGTTINLTILQDNYNPAKARKNIKELLEKFDTSVILAPLGGPTTYAYIDLIKNKKLAVLFPITTDSKLRKSNLKGLINFGPGYKTIEKFAFNYAVENLHARKFAFFYQNDLAGTMIPQLTKNLSPENYISVPYKRGPLRLRQKALKIKKFIPDVLFLWSSPAAAKTLIKQIGPMNLRNTTIISYRLGSKKFKMFLKENNILWQHIGIENVPNPDTSDLELVKEYRNTIAKGFLDTYSLEAYIVTKLFLGLLKEIKGTITKEKILTTAQNIKNYDFKGIPLHFEPQTRQLSNAVWLDKGQETWEKIILKTSKPKAPEKEPKPIIKKKAKPTIEKKQKPKPVTQQTPAKKPKAIKKPRPIKKQTPVKEKKEIIIGTTQDTTGLNREYCKKVIKTMNTCFRNVNRQGGINGKKIKLIVQDDDYKPKKARKNIINFINRGIDIIFSPHGGPTTESFLDLIKQRKIAVIFPDTGAPSLYNPNFKYMIHAYPSYDELSIIAIKFLIQKKNAQKIAICYPDNIATGTAKKIAIEKNKMNKDDYILVTYRTGTASFTKQGEQIRDFAPDAIDMAALTEPAVKILKGVGVTNLMNIPILTNLEGGEKFIRFINQNDLASNWINIEYTPNPFESQMEIMKNYRRDMGSQAITTEGAQTYIKTQIFIELLKKIKGPITKEKIIKAAEQTKKANFKGFPVSFIPEKRQLSYNIWVKDGKNPLWTKFPTITFKKEKDTKAQKTP